MSNNEIIIYTNNNLTLSNIKAKPRYVCQICDKVYKSIQRLEHHQKMDCQGCIIIEEGISELESLRRENLFLTNKVTKLEKKINELQHLNTKLHGSLEILQQSTNFQHSSFANPYQIELEKFRTCYLPLLTCETFNKQKIKLSNEGLIDIIMNDISDQSNPNNYLQLIRECLELYPMRVSLMSSDSDTERLYKEVISDISHVLKNIFETDSTWKTFLWQFNENRPLISWIVKGKNRA